MEKVKPEIGDIVEVRFFDLADDNHWLSIPEAAGMKPPQCKIIGYLLKDAISHLVVTSFVSEDGDCGYWLVIPKGCVIGSITLIEEAEVDDFLQPACPGSSAEVVGRKE